MTPNAIGACEGKFEPDRRHMSNAAQTQPNIRGIGFNAKSSVAKKPERVKKKDSVKVTHKNTDPTQTNTDKKSLEL